MNIRTINFEKVGPGQSKMTGIFHFTLKLIADIFVVEELA